MNCPLGAVIYFLDSPVSAEDISLPKVLSLSDLLEPEEEAEVELDVVCKRQTELEELSVRLENLHTEYKKDMAGMGDRITAALIENTLLLMWNWSNLWPVCACLLALRSSLPWTRTNSLSQNDGTCFLL